MRPDVAIPYLLLLGYVQYVTAYAVRLRLPSA
jgi:hypothetical protein